MRRIATFCLAVLAPACASAAEVQRLAPDVSVLIGTSCNVIIVGGAGGEGALIIDDQRRFNVEETRAAVQEVTASPVRTVINTHWHLDHSGGNAAFAASGATIVAQRNVRARRSTEQFMAAYNQHIPPDPAAALPAVVYDRKLRLHQGAEAILLRHVAAAHTDGDTIVRIEEADVVAMGDVFFNGIFPFIDRSSGGSIQGMIKGVDVALGMAGPHTRIVPAHGPVAGRQDLVAYRAMLDDVARRVRAGIRAGDGREKIIASHPAAAYRKGMEGEEDRFVGAIYDSYMGV